RFSTIVRDIQDTAHEVSTGTSQVASTVQQVSHEATKQAAALTMGAQAIGDLSASAAAVSQRTQSAMKVSARALDAVRSGHDSIEALAEQSQLALRQIQDVVERNQHETVGVVEAIEDVTAQVATGARTVQNAAEAFSLVDGVVQELADLNVFIASASSAQARQ